MLGAREGALTGLRRLMAAAMARDIGVFIVPGPEIARTYGLDIAAAGLRPVASPRHASVLLVVGPMTAVLREAASVVYAQMVRPRAVFALGGGDLSPLPAADVAAGLSQEELVSGVQQLRRAFAEGAFRPDVSDFDAPALRTRVEYACPMHPEVVSDQPGYCPKCGMTLMPREAQAAAGHAHGKQQNQDAGENMQAAMPLGHQGGHHDQHAAAAADYSCPMHPEVSKDGPGSCPKCGMTLAPREVEAKPGHGHHNMDHGQMDHGQMDHSQMDHSGSAFMSMVDVTKDLPRSGDGLPMEWVDAPFGPFFPGLPGGLMLRLSLDGDTIAGSEARAAVEAIDLLHPSQMAPEAFVERLASVAPLAPIAYRFLACKALESAAGVTVEAGVARARAGALERERIASHLCWLALFARQTGFGWLEIRAVALQLTLQRADPARIKALKPAVLALIRRLLRTPLLETRLSGIGLLAQDTKLRGPVARASGRQADARGDDPAYAALGFAPVGRSGGDALGRLQVRLDEMAHSLDLIEAAGVIALPVPMEIGAASGGGEAVVETPRGLARLQVRLEGGAIVAAEIDTPSTHHLGLIGAMIDQQELGDALVAVGSLDLSPWEVRV